MAAVSKEAMLAGLRDIRLPPPVAGEAFADVAASVGLAGVLALAVALCWRAIAERQTRPRPATLSAQVEAFAELPEGERRSELLKLLKNARADRFASLRPHLYRPDAPFTNDQIAREILRD